MWLDLQRKYLQSLPTWVISCSVQAGGGMTTGSECRTGWSRYLWPLWSRAASPSTLIILRADLSARLPCRPTAATWWSANWILNQLRDQEGGRERLDNATSISITLNYSNLKTRDCDLVPDKEMISVNKDWLIDWSVKSRAEILTRTEIRCSLPGREFTEGRRSERNVSIRPQSPLNVSIRAWWWRNTESQFKGAVHPKLEFSRYIVTHTLMENRVKQNSVAAFHETSETAGDLF